MGMNLIQTPEDLSLARFTFGFHEDFDWYISPHRWTSVLTDSGSAAVGDVTGGVLTLTPSDGSVADNDEAYTHTTNSVWLIADGKPVLAEAFVQFTELATNKANVFFGIMDAIAANTLVDDGAGMKASFSGAAIYKVDGGTVWKCISSISTVQTITATAITAGGSDYIRLRIEIRPITTTLAEVTFWYDNGSGLVQFMDPSQTKATPIKHTITYTGAAQMQVGAGVKNGSTDNQTLKIDYISVWAKR